MGQVQKINRILGAAVAAEMIIDCLTAVVVAGQSWQQTAQQRPAREARK